MNSKKNKPIFQQIMQYLGTIDIIGKPPRKKKKLPEGKSRKQWSLEPVGNGFLAFRPAPGKKSVGEWFDDEHNVGTVITLLRADEMANRKIDFEKDWMPKYDSFEKWFHYPITGRSFPDPNDTTNAMKAAECMQICLCRGERVALHCSAGMHRTGVVGFICFRLMGNSFEESLDLADKVRLVTGGELRDKDCALAKLADAIYSGEPLPSIPRDNFKRKKK